MFYISPIPRCKPLSLPTHLPSLETVKKSVRDQVKPDCRLFNVFFVCSTYRNATWFVQSVSDKGEWLDGVLLFSATLDVLDSFLCSKVGLI